jgi:hypothetical protein
VQQLVREHVVDESRRSLELRAASSMRRPREPRRAVERFPSPPEQPAPTAISPQRDSLFRALALDDAKTVLAPEVEGRLA